jgi:hypothetical protein
LELKWELQYFSLEAFHKQLQISTTISLNRWAKEEGIMKYPLADLLETKRDCLVVWTVKQTEHRWRVRGDPNENRVAGNQCRQKWSYGKWEA